MAKPHWAWLVTQGENLIQALRPLWGPYAIDPAGEAWVHPKRPFMQRLNCIVFVFAVSVDSAGAQLVRVVASF